MQTQDLLSDDLTVSANIKTYLAEAAKWGKFLSITGFVGCGFMVIAAFLMPVMLSRMPLNEMGMGGLPLAISTSMTIFYLIMAFILFLPCLYLYRFSVRMKGALNHSNEAFFEESFRNLKSLFRFNAILVIIILSIYVFAMLLTMIGSAIMALT